MALPITAKPDKSATVGVAGPGHSYWYSSQRTKQVRPYNKPTSYTYSRSNTVSAYRWGQYGNHSYASFASATAGYNPAEVYAIYRDIGDPYVAEALNGAREDFRDSCSAQAENLVNLAERKQAFAMMTKRMTSLYRFGKALRRFDLAEAANALGVSKRNTRGRDFADMWLEYWFGWKPLVQDIYNSCELLSRDFAVTPLKGRKKIVYEYTWTRTTGSWPYYVDEKATHLGRVVAEFQAYVRVTNPNLALMSAAGLTNPAVVVWELIPFSFVVDWFSNVGSYLKSFSDFHGVELVDPHYGFKALDQCTWDQSARPPSTPGGRGAQSVRIRTRRILGTPEVTLKRKGFILSPTRAATALSLLRQIL